MVYSNYTGYGFVNAAAAVAAAIGQSPFPNVADERYPDGWYQGEDWGINMVRAPEAWVQGYEGQGITVAVLDTGVDLNHPDLADNIWTNTGEIADNGYDDDGNGYIDDVYGWNFFYGQNNTWDLNGHGTHVAGTIAAVDNDGEGITGVAPSAKIMPIQVLPDTRGESGEYLNTLTNGIYYAVDNGARVINLSLRINISSSNSNLEAALAYASQRGVIVVMAAGNNGGESPVFPATYASNWGVAVGAVDRNNSLANVPGEWQSNKAGYNSPVYVTAPGVDIYSTKPNDTSYFTFDDYQTMGGTSMATPHVAGVVAMMLSANANLTDADVRNILASTSSNSLSVSSLNTQFYRFQNSSNPGTYLYVGEQESQNILNNYSNFVNEGSAFKVGVAPGDDLLPLYRFQNSSKPGTYLYVGEEERRSILLNNPGFEEEGLAYYVYGVGAGLGTPMYRFQNSSNPGTYLYAGAQERDAILASYPNLIDEGVAFEIAI